MTSRHVPRNQGAQIAQLEREIRDLKSRLAAPDVRLLGSVSVATEQSSISTTELDRTGLSVSVAVPSGRRIQARAFSRFGTTVDHNIALIYIYQDAAQVALGGANCLDNSSVSGIAESQPFASASGTFTFKVTVQKAAGGPGGFVSSLAANGARAWLAVYDVGPA